MSLSLSWWVCHRQMARDKSGAQNLQEQVMCDDHTANPWVDGMMIQG